MSPIFYQLRRNCAQSQFCVAVTRNCEIFIVTARNFGAPIAVKNFMCSTKIDCDAVTRNRGKTIAVARSCGTKFAVTRSCVAIFRNYGSQCVRSYAQLRRILIAMENMGIIDWIHDEQLIEPVQYHSL